jgi:hypothetical protein
VTSTWSLFWLLAQAAAAPATPSSPEQSPAPAAAAPSAQAAPAAPPPAPPPPPPPARAAPPPRPPPLAPLTPFRLSLTYVHVLREDGGELANPNTSTNAVGIDMAFPSNNYVRNHLGLAHQWETAGGITARGFRIDLISLGYPIPLVISRNASFRLDLEPILTVVRTEIMFISGGERFLRLASGFSLELSATLRHWFVTLQAFGIDFRYWFYSSERSLTGFSRVFPLRVAIGHEF